MEEREVFLKLPSLVTLWRQLKFKYLFLANFFLTFAFNILCLLKYSNDDAKQVLTVEMGNKMFGLSDKQTNTFATQPKIFLSFTVNFGVVLSRILELCIPPSHFRVKFYFFIRPSTMCKKTFKRFFCPHFAFFVVKDIVLIFCHGFSSHSKGYIRKLLYYFSFLVLATYSKYYVKFCTSFCRVNQALKCFPLQNDSVNSFLISSLHYNHYNDYNKYVFNRCCIIILLKLRIHCDEEWGKTLHNIYEILLWEFFFCLS